MTGNLRKWDIRFLKMAREVSTWSKDPSTAVGAVITRGNKFISLGYNGFAASVADTQERLQDRDIRLKLTIHSEINAILTTNEELEGCTMYTYPFQPCTPCASKILQKKIKRVVTLISGIQRWKEDWKLAQEILRDAKVELVFYKQCII